MSCQVLVSISAPDTIAPSGQETEISFSGSASQHIDLAHRGSLLCWARLAKKTRNLCIYIYTYIQVSFSGWYRLGEHYDGFDSASINDHSIAGHMEWSIV